MMLCRPSRKNEKAPHVFGNIDVSNIDEGLDIWEEIKSLRSNSARRTANEQKSHQCILMGTAIIWGFAFVAQRGMGNINFMFSGITFSAHAGADFYLCRQQEKAREFDNITAEDRAEERKNLKKEV